MRMESRRRTTSTATRATATTVIGRSRLWAAKPAPASAITAAPRPSDGRSSKRNMASSAARNVTDTSDSDHVKVVVNRTAGDRATISAAVTATRGDSGVRRRASRHRSTQATPPRTALTASAAWYATTGSDVSQWIGAISVPKPGRHVLRSNMSQRASPPTKRAMAS